MGLFGIMHVCFTLSEPEDCVDAQGRSSSARTLILWHHDNLGRILSTWQTKMFRMDRSECLERIAVRGVETAEQLGAKETVVHCTSLEDMSLLRTVLQGLEVRTPATVSRCRESELQPPIFAEVDTIRSMQKELQKLRAELVAEEANQHAISEM